MLPHSVPSVPSVPHPALLLLDALNMGPAFPVVARAIEQVVARHNLPVVLLARSDEAQALLREHAPAVILHAALTLPDASCGAALNEALATCFGTAPLGDVVLVRARSLPEGATADWLATLFETARQHPEAGLVAGRSVTMDGRIWADGHRLVTGLGLHHPGYLYRHLEDDAGTACHEVDSADLDLALLRHDALRSVRFDPHLELVGLLDDDLAFAVRVVGFSVCVTGAVKAVRLDPMPPPEGAQLPALAGVFERASALRRVEAEYWTRKWGWDPLLPDTGRLLRLYGTTRAGWQLGETLRWTCAEAHPTVDLCMVTWNGAAHLARCLQSLAATSYPADRLTLYVIDNASTDDTPKLLDSLLPALPFATHVRRLAVNVGGVAGMNWAMAEGRGQLVAKLDDDIIVPPNWLEDLVNVFRQRPFAGVTGPRIVDDTAVRRIQCADYASHPQPVTHEQEPDEGQTSALARVTHVRGCCNLYRRDAIRRCGPLDIRYSPSQWDDPDHQLALLVAGYEVIHEGRVAVAHKMTTGSVSSGLSLANAALNKAKMQVKWGHDAPMLLETALLLSDEGRYVGPWTEAPKTTPGTSPEAAPNPSLTPCPGPCPGPVEPDLVRHMEALRAAHTLSPSDAEALDRMLRAQARQLCGQAAESRQQGQEAAVLPQLRAAVSCAPHDPLSVLSLAEALGDNDATVKAALVRRRAEALAEGSGVTAQRRVLVLPPEGASCQRALTSVPRVDELRPHALWCIPHSRRFDAALMTRLEDAAQALERHDWRVTLDSAPCPRFGETRYRVMHCWTLDAPHETLAQLKAAASLRPHLPRLLSPVWNSPAEALWLAEAMLPLKQGRVDNLPPPPPQLERAVQAAHHDADPTAALFRRQALALAHTVLLRHPSEAAALGLAEASCRFTPTERPPLPQADPRLFREASGLSHFVLGVAPITPAAGQAQLLTALAPLNLPVVLIGEAPEAWYLHLCRRLMPSCLFVQEADPDLLASAFAAASVHALPALGSLGERAALMAAGFATHVVAARTSPECQQITTARPCDPWHLPSIANAVREALAAPRPLASLASPLAASALAAIYDTYAFKEPHHVACQS